MNLSTPHERKLSHTRSITCNGYERADDLWDIEAHLVDTKPFTVSILRYGKPRVAGTPLHEMKIRLTVDNAMTIHAAEAVTAAAPFDSCSVPPLAFEKLKGISLHRGWRKKVNNIMGGILGCTHLNDLFGVVVTQAYQTIAGSQEFTATVESGTTTPFFINSCHSYRTDGEVIRTRYPEHYRPPVSTGKS